MAFTVEDGSGLADANSYLSQDDFQTYADSHGLSYADKTDDEIEAALIRATQYIDGRYRGRWPGSRVNGRSQSLEWPRDDAVDADGEDIADDELPRELLDAVAEAAFRELNDSGSLSPDYSARDNVSREAVGPIETEYFEPQSLGAVRPTVPVIDELLSGILMGGLNMVSLVRA